MKQKILMKLPPTITAREAVDWLKDQPGVLKTFIASPTSLQITYSCKHITLEQIVRTIKHQKQAA